MPPAPEDGDGSPPNVELLTEGQSHGTLGGHPVRTPQAPSPPIVAGQALEAVVIGPILGLAEPGDQWIVTEVGLAVAVHDDRGR